MSWEVAVSDEFIDWYSSLTQNERVSIAAGIELLELKGPALGRPYVDTLSASRFSNMKELRVQHEGRPYRILFGGFKYEAQRSDLIVTVA